MIIAEQMKDAMDDQMAKVVAERLKLLDRFASHRLEGKHDVAQQNRSVGWGGCPRFPGPKRKYIC